MTASRTTAPRHGKADWPPLISGLGAFLALVPILIGAALGQPEKTADCPVPRCLEVQNLPTSAEDPAPKTGVGLPVFTDRLALRYRGETPFTAHLVAARYDEGRLVDYAVSERMVVRTAGDGLTVNDAGSVLRQAFAGNAEGRLRIEALDHARLSPEAEIATAAFIGEVPSSYLAGTDPTGLIPLEKVDPDNFAEIFPGSIGVIAALPENEALRGAEKTRVGAVLVRLQYAEPSVETAESE